MEVGLWMDSVGEYPANSNQTTNAINLKPGSETVGDKLHSREGNSPDHQLRSLRAD